MAVFCGFILCFSAQAGGRGYDSVRLVTGGIKAETNVSGLFFPGVSPEVVDVEAGAGATVGGFIFFDFHPRFGLQMELLYHVRTAKAMVSGPEGQGGSIFYAGCEVPFYFAVQWRLAHCGRLFLHFGPTVEFGYVARIWENGRAIDLYAKDEETELSAMKDLSMGWALAFGYEFRFGLQLHAVSRLGFYNLLDAGRSHISAYPYAFSVGVSYRFGALAGKGGRHGR